MRFNFQCILGTVFERQGPVLSFHCHLPSLKLIRNPFTKGWQCVLLTWARLEPTTFRTTVVLLVSNHLITVPLYAYNEHDKNQQNEGAPSEDSYQPGHPPSLIRDFAVCMKKPWVPSYPLSAQQRLIRLGRCQGWSESSLGAHSFCWFCHVVAHYLLTFWSVSCRSRGALWCSVAGLLRAEGKMIGWNINELCYKIRDVDIAWFVLIQMRMHSYPTGPDLRFLHTRPQFPWFWLGLGNVVLYEGV